MHQHTFEKSKFKEGYEFCPECGTHHSIAQVPPKQLYENDYWEHSTGHSTFDEQKFNLTESLSCGISKVDKVMQYIPRRKVVLEIGCSPGSLLRKLSENGYACYGVEPDFKYVEPILKEAPFSQVINGYFPDVFPEPNQSLFDYVIAMDVLEHCDDYDSFVKTVHRILVPGGTAIFMIPLIDECRSVDFLPSEHCWIFSKSFLKEYLGSIFSDVKFDIWQEGHSMIIVNK